MTRATANVTRLVRERVVDPLVRCTFADLDNRLRNEYGTCGAMIPYRPRHACPECGQKQVQAVVSEPPPDAEIIEGNAAIVDAETREVTAVQVIAVPDLANRLADALREVHWDAPITKRNKPANEGRLSGMIVTHRTFGFTTPVPLRRRYACAASRFDFDYPEASALIAEYLVAAEHVFRTQAREVYDETAEHVLEAIAPAWRIAGTPWTSGIINHTAALPYHRDSGNIKGSWSAMLSVRRNVEGGLLHLADYGLYLRVPNGSISVFDGQSVLHGVTPFRLTAPHAYRFTAVAYARAGMRSCCADPRDEAKRAARAATEAVDKRREVKP